MRQDRIFDTVSAFFVFLALHITLTRNALAIEDQDAHNSLNKCEAYDFEWQYTECDSLNKRWRVQVPKKTSDCMGGTPKAPVRGLDCDFVCDPGSFLNSESDEQKCESCAPGTYSLGGGQRFEDWDEMPTDFRTEIQEFSISHSKPFAFLKNISCEQTRWRAQGKNLVSVPSLCDSRLSYTAELISPGVVRFSYQAPADQTLLRFEVENNLCQMNLPRKNTILNKTNEDEYAVYELELPAGTNRLIWTTFGFSVTSGDSFQKPVRINYIEIIGMAFTQTCTECPAGSYSIAGASKCDTCPLNTFSTKGSSQCEACDPDLFYAPEASSSCLERPPCRVTDFYEFYEACGPDGNTRRNYKWHAPKVCKDDVSGSVQLPAPGDPQPCPPCNPGMTKGGRGCGFCAADEYSDGSGPCNKCPGSTAPQRGLYVQWWNDLPFNINISTDCVSVFGESACVSSKAETWLTNIDHLQTSPLNSDDAFHVLRMRVGGFLGKPQNIGGHLTSLATVKFVFETQCTGDCTLFFLQDNKKKKLSVIENWRQSQAQTEYTYEVTDNRANDFMWVFRKSPLEEALLEPVFEHVNDYARIYVVNITNTLTGGAASCVPCPRGADPTGCIPCGPGEYVDNMTTECTPCPVGTIESGVNMWGQDSCVRCGEGLTPWVKDSKAMCATSCKYNDVENDLKYNFQDLSSPLLVKGLDMFDSQGQAYYHAFNLSLCGGSHDFPLAHCSNNLSTIRGEDSFVQSVICQSAILPTWANKKVAYHSSQPISLADSLVHITTRSPIDMIYEITGFALPTDEEYLDNDVFFYYKAKEKTSSCRSGRGAVIMLRCDPRVTEPEVELPPNCGMGTCDGCDFIFLVRSKAACPVCDEKSAQAIPGECHFGVQPITYLMPKHCGSSVIKTHENPCEILPLWLEISLLCGALLAIMLFCIILYCWKRNRKLEYSYMKLVGSSSDNADIDESKLPAAETCALEEDEEQHFDAVEFSNSQGQGRRFLSRLKGLTSKKGDNPFGDMQMDDRKPLT